jgi:hypothetical protein
LNGGVGDGDGESSGAMIIDDDEGRIVVELRLPEPLEETD